MQKLPAAGMRYMHCSHLQMRYLFIGCPRDNCAAYRRSCCYLEASECSSLQASVEQLEERVN